MGDKRFYVPVLTVLALTAVVVLVRVLSDLPEDWAAYVCKPDDCTVQAWLSATAGWVGFAAAAIGAYLIFAQLTEQRRQTSFMLGDGEPTVDIVRGSNGEKSCSFRLVNWNRRTVVLASLKIRSSVDLPKPVHFIKFTEDGDEMPPVDISAKGRIGRMPALPGWENRQGPPATLECCFKFDDEVAPDEIPVGYLEPITVEFSTFTPSEHDQKYTRIRVKGIRGNVLPKSIEWKRQQTKIR